MDIFVNHTVCPSSPTCLFFDCVTEVLNNSAHGQVSDLSLPHLLGIARFYPFAQSMLSGVYQKYGVCEKRPVGVAFIKILVFGLEEPIVAVEELFESRVLTEGSDVDVGIVDDFPVVKVGITGIECAFHLSECVVKVADLRV